MSLNLLLLTSSLDCGGAETHICALSSALAAKGHHVTVASAGGALTGTLTGVRHCTLPLHKKTPLSLLRARLGLARLLKKGHFDLIHAHARIPAALVAPLAKRRNIPLVTTVHASFRGGTLRTKLSQWGEHSIAVGEDLKQYLMDTHSVPAHCISVIPNGIDTRYFCPLEDPSPSDGTVRLVFVSRLDRDCSRAAFLLCRMAAVLKKACPSLEIHIAGGGNALPALKHLTEAVNRRADSPFVFLSGTVQDLRPLYRSADAVIGVSRVALEAMACGVPVVLAGNEGMLGLVCERLLSSAAAGNFCCRDGEPLTEEGLRSELLRLLSLSVRRRRELGGILCEYVRRHHSLFEMTARTEDLYTEVLSLRPAKHPADVVLCGYYGFGNTGDDALLHAAIRRAVTRFPDCTLSALTRRGKKDIPFFGIRCVRRWHPLAVRRELCHAERLIFGGGTLLQDRTSFRSLLYYATLLLYAKRKGLTIELWGNGLIPPETAWGERLIPACLGRCDRIGLRDGASLAWALSQGIRTSEPKIFFEPDLALSTPTASAERIDFLCRRFGLLPPPNGKAPRGFGIVALRGGMGPGYLKIMVAWLTTLHAEQMRLLFVPMCPTEDERICRRLATLFGATVAVHLSPSDLVGLASRARIVCGTRLHALIFAAASETPFVGFGNDPKIEAFCREHGGVFFTDLY